MLRICLLILAVSACSARPRFVVITDASDATTDRPDGAAGGNGGNDTAPADSFVAPDGPVSSCSPDGERMHTVMESTQVSSTDGLVYTSDPPSSGPNCGVPGVYGVYSESQPLGRCYWLNNLARGGIVLLYNCPGGCPDVIEQLTSSLRGMTDPDCPAAKRVIITPDPTLPTRVAAAAWGYTWTSGCLDAATAPRLIEFMNAHAGSKGAAPERHLSACQ